jgi:hypothetical protein
MTAPPSTSGEMACVVVAGTFLGSPGFRHSGVPVAASQAVTVPVMPIEYNRPPKNVGVDFGP